MCRMGTRAGSEDGNETVRPEASGTSKVEKGFRVEIPRASTGLEDAGSRACYRTLPVRVQVRDTE